MNRFPFFPFAPGRAAALLGVFLALGVSAAAPAAAQDADSTRIAELERRMEALTREIERLSLGDEVVQADTSIGGLGYGASKVYAIQRGVSVGGYGEFLYENYASTREDDAPANRRGFSFETV